MIPEFIGRLPVVATLEELDEDIMDAADADDKLDNSDRLFTKEDIDEINQNISEQTDNSYKARINMSLKLLKLNGNKYLSKTGLKVCPPAHSGTLDLAIGIAPFCSR